MNRRHLFAGMVAGLALSGLAVAASADVVLGTPDITSNTLNINYTVNSTTHIGTLNVNSTSPGTSYLLNQAAGSSTTSGGFGLTATFNVSGSTPTLLTATFDNTYGGSPNTGFHSISPITSDFSIGGAGNAKLQFVFTDNGTGTLPAGTLVALDLYTGDNFPMVGKIDTFGSDDNLQAGFTSNSAYSDAAPVAVPLPKPVLAGGLLFGLLGLGIVVRTVGWARLSKHAAI